MKQFFVILFLTISHFIYGQTVTGMVVYENNQPADGVIIHVKGKSTTTDTNGSYDIMIDSLSMLTIWQNGYKPLVFDVKSDTIINATLYEDLVVLNEFIITASIKRHKVRYISTRNNNDIKVIRNEEPKTEVVNLEKYWQQDTTSLWAKAIYDNMSYPVTMMENFIEGTIYAKFKISSNGEMLDLELVRKVEPELDNEVLRTLKLMPNWSSDRSFMYYFTYSNQKYYGIFILPVRFIVKEIKD